MGDWAPASCQPAAVNPCTEKKSDPVKPASPPVATTPADKVVKGMRRVENASRCVASAPQGDKYFINGCSQPIEVYSCAIAEGPGSCASFKRDHESMESMRDRLDDVDVVGTTTMRPGEGWIREGFNIGVCVSPALMKVRFNAVGNDFTYECWMKN